MGNEPGGTFRFSYSAKQQEEVIAIRKKYQSIEEDKMEQLRKLDESTTKKSTIVAMVLGVLGCLIFGTGMSCVLVFEHVWFVPGIIVGVFGIVMMILAYPVYAKITKKERERIAPEIIRLADDLLK